MHSDTVGLGGATHPAAPALDSEPDGDVQGRARRLVQQVFERGLATAVKGAAPDASPQPRTHQVEAVSRLLEAVYGDCLAPEPVNYLMQHSTGSGKSFTIAALAVSLAGWSDCSGGVVGTVLVLNDRLQLDWQLGEAVEAFWRGNCRPPGGLRRATTTAELAGFLAAPPGAPHRPAIVLTTVQKLATLWRAGGGRARTTSAAAAMAGGGGGGGGRQAARIAVIADEAHRHHGHGTTDQIHQILAGALGIGSSDGGGGGGGRGQGRRPQPRQQPRGVTYFGFTATPSPKALQLFGVATEAPSDPWVSDGGRSNSGSDSDRDRNDDRHNDGDRGKVGEGDDGRDRGQGGRQLPGVSESARQVFKPTRAPTDRQSLGKQQTEQQQQQQHRRGAKANVERVGSTTNSTNELEQLLLSSLSATEGGADAAGGGGGGGHCSETALLYAPFHSYTMRNAVQDGFVLDVLRSYTAVTPRLQIAGLRGGGGRGGEAGGVDPGLNPQLVDPGADPDPDPDPDSAAGPEGAALAGIAEEVLVEAASNSRDVVEHKAAYIVQRFVAMWRAASAAGFPSLRGMVVARSRQHVVWFVQALRRAVADEPEFHRLAEAAAAADPREAELYGSGGPAVYGAFSGSIPLPEEQARQLAEQCRRRQWRRGYVGGVGGGGGGAARAGGRGGRGEGRRGEAEADEEDLEEAEGRGHDSDDSGDSDASPPSAPAASKRRRRCTSGPPAAGSGPRRRGRPMGRGESVGGRGRSVSGWDAALAHLDVGGGGGGGGGQEAGAWAAAAAGGREDGSEGGAYDSENGSGSRSGSGGGSGSEDGEGSGEGSEWESGLGREDESSSGSEGSDSDDGRESEGDESSGEGESGSGSGSDSDNDMPKRRKAGRGEAAADGSGGSSGDGGGGGSRSEGDDQADIGTAGGGRRGGGGGGRPRKRLRTNTGLEVEEHATACTGSGVSAGGGGGGGASSLFGSCGETSLGSDIQRPRRPGAVVQHAVVRRRASRLAASSKAEVATPRCDDDAAAAEAGPVGAGAGGGASAGRVMTRAMSSTAVADAAVDGAAGGAVRHVSVSEADVNGRGADPSAARLLVVCSKYETGYDDPRLGAMFIDRTLSGARAVQVLGRLNRPAPGLGKSAALLGVVDFVNSVGGLREAFEEFYDVTTLHTGKHARRLRQERQMERALARILETLQPAADKAAAAAAAGGGGGGARRGATPATAGGSTPGGRGGGDLMCLGVAEMAALACSSWVPPETRRALEGDLGQYVALAGALRAEMPEMPLPFAAALLARLTSEREAREQAAATFRRAAAAAAGGGELGDGAAVGSPQVPDVQVAVCELEEVFSGAIYLGPAGGGVNGGGSAAVAPEAGVGAGRGVLPGGAKGGGGAGGGAGDGAGGGPGPALARFRGRPLAAGRSRRGRQGGGGGGGGGGRGRLRGAGGGLNSLDRKIRKNRPLSEVIAAANAALDGRYERRLAAGFKEVCARLAAAAKAKGAAASAAAADGGEAAMDMPYDEDVYELLSLLRRLSLWPVSVEQLRSTGVGKEVALLRKHACPQVASLARSLVARWKTIAATANPATTAATAAAKSNAKTGRTATLRTSAGGGSGTAGPAGLDEQLRSKARAMLADSLRSHVVAAARLRNRDPAASDLDSERLALAARALEAAIFDSYGTDASSYKSRTRMLVTALKHADGVAADLLAGTTDPRVMATADSMALAPASVRAQAEELERRKRQEMEAWEKLAGQGGGASTYKSAATVCPSCGGSGATVHNVLSGGTYAQERVQIQKFVCDHCGNTWRSD